MWVLGVETSGDRGGVALLADCGRGYELAFDAGRVHAEALGTATEALVNVVGIARAEVSLVAVDIGPGSFTGIRIGMAFASGVAQALGLPTVGVRQTEVLGLWASRAWPGRVVVWIHDRGPHLYVAWVNEGRVGQATAMPLERALQRCSGRSDLLVVGSGAERFREELAPLAPGVLAGMGYVHPSPLEVARLGLERWKQGKGLSAGQLEPHYVHPPVAQRKEQ